METGLGGKTIVVTGAGAGIGFATTRMFIEEGANVVAADLDVAPLAAIGAEAQLAAFEVDLSDPDGPARAVEHAIDRFGTIDGLVNNVGIAPTRGGSVEISDEEWQRTLNLNFSCMVRASRAAIPHMVSRGSGSVLSVASEVARQPDVFLADYSVSKAAVLLLAKILAMEFGTHGIRSNAVSPGPTRTQLWDNTGGFTDCLAEEYRLGREEAVEHFAKEIRKLPLGRIGAPDDVAAAIVFLMSDRASQVTGSEYCVDSGVKKAV